MRNIRKIFFSLAAGSLVALSASAGEPPMPARAIAEAAITKLMAARELAWNQHDAKAAVQLFSDDATVIALSGRVVKGKAALWALFDEPGLTKNSTSTMTLDSIQWLAVDVALVDGTQKLVGMDSPDGKPMSIVKIHYAAVVQKVGADWLLTAVRPYQFVKNPPPAPAEHAAK
jgi:uncharacterized protein (TIGR02246 family)